MLSKNIMEGSVCKCPHALPCFARVAHANTLFVA